MYDFILPVYTIIIKKEEMTRYYDLTFEIYGKDPTLLNIVDITDDAVFTRRSRSTNTGNHHSIDQINLSNKPVSKLMYSEILNGAVQKLISSDGDTTEQFHQQSTKHPGKLQTTLNDGTMLMSDRKVDTDDSTPNVARIVKNNDLGQPDNKNDGTDDSTLLMSDRKVDTDDSTLNVTGLVKNDDLGQLGNKKID